jgi:hypothetical protein
MYSSTTAEERPLFRIQLGCRQAGRLPFEHSLAGRAGEDVAIGFRGDDCNGFLASVQRHKQFTSEILLSAKDSQSLARTGAHFRRIRAEEAGT